MQSNRAIIQFQRDCFAQYLTDIQNRIPDFPSPYLYPDGNPIRPVIPVQTTTNKIMLVGAFPSARFERRNGKLIPIGDNLAPFEPEHYFDGQETRIQESTARLNQHYLPQLGLSRDDLWITDLVKVYLYPKAHLKNCQALFPSIKFINTHQMFPKVADASVDWFQREVSVCQPCLIITLGSVAARAISKKFNKTNVELLDGLITDFRDGIKIVHLAHPEARRRNPEWDKSTAQQIDRLKEQIQAFLQ